MITSAHEAARSRWCSADRCENDAEATGELCLSCERKRARGEPVRLHGDPRPTHKPELYCWACGQWKIDDEYAENQRRWNQLYRRSRDYICRQCLEDRTCAHAANRRRRRKAS